MSKAAFRRIEPMKALDLLAHPDLRIIDVRDKTSFEQGRIGEAQHADMSKVERMLISADKEKPVLVYCYHGNASQTYAQMFADFGFREVYSLDGGYQEWQQMTSSGNQEMISLSMELSAWLFEQGFPPYNANSVIAGKITPLMQAARFGTLEIATELIACGSKLNARNSDGNNALWLACYNGSKEMMRLLISKGIDINNQNESGASCLMYAASTGKADVVETLLEAGADYSLQTPDEFSALDMAASIECLNLLRTASKKLLAVGP